MRFHLPSRAWVRTSATLTLKTFSTAWRISTLLASTATSKVTVFVLFLLLHALLGHQRPDEHRCGGPS